jgi:hypothetical protein
MSSGGTGTWKISGRDAGEAGMEDASIFIAEILLPFSPNPELYPLRIRSLTALIARFGTWPVGPQAHNAAAKCQS